MLHIPIVHARDVSKQIPGEKKCQLCVHRDMKHLGSLESTQEARVALSYASRNSYASFKGSTIQQPSTCLLSYRNITDKK